MNFCVIYFRIFFPISRRNSGVGLKKSYVYSRWYKIGEKLTQINNNVNEREKFLNCATIPAKV